MSIKTTIQNKAAKYLFSPKRRDAKRRKAERQRQAVNAPHVVEYYHDAGDPYSHLMAQVLPEFCQRYDIELEVNIVSPPPDWAAPDRERLDAYARKDAARLAVRAGLTFVDPGEQPSSAVLSEVNAAFVSAIEASAFLQQAENIGSRLWSGESIASEVKVSAKVAQSLADATQQREAKGHYLGATLYYAGEWYWGIDRLHYLEARFRALGAATDVSLDPIFSPPIVPSLETQNNIRDRPELHWYLSFRSPYTGITADRIKALADAHAAELKLRYVLPMVMRGMQVPRAKGFYIMRDTVREAERMGIPFGNMCDPVGEPVERGYAILHRAIEQGKGFEFAKSFLSGVWSEGIDAGSDRGLRSITERAGLSWTDVKPLIGGDHWRADAEANQEEMFSHGVWGVPSFRVDDVAVWGQDRLWVIEEGLVAKASEKK